MLLPKSKKSPLVNQHHQQINKRNLDLTEFCPTDFPLLHSWWGLASLLERHSDQRRDTVVLLAR